MDLAALEVDLGVRGVDLGARGVDLGVWVVDLGALGMRFSVAAGPRAGVAWCDAM